MPRLTSAAWARLTWMQPTTSAALGIPSWTWLAGYRHGPWQLGVYVNNVTDRRFDAVGLLNGNDSGV